MNQKTTMTYVCDDRENITITTNGVMTRDEVYMMVRRFMLAIGYVIDSDIEIGEIGDE